MRSRTLQHARKTGREMHGLIHFFALLVTLFLSLRATAQEQDTRAASKSHENVIYGMHGGLALLMDVYQPEKPNGHALLFINGCGWHSPPGYDSFLLKDGSSTPARVRPLVDLGFTVFTINHRTAPLFRYPIPVEDAQRAVRFIRHHRKQYGVTSDKIAAIGHSSGGHLTLMLTLRSLPGDESAVDPVERERANIDAAASLAGPTDLAADDWSAWAARTIASFVGDRMDFPSRPGFDAGVNKEASPITYVDGDDPPVLLIHGTADPIVPVTQARSLVASLREHKVETDYWEVNGAGHVNLLRASEADNDAHSMEDVGQWLLDRLRKP